MTGEKYDPVPDLALLLDAARRAGWSALSYVDRLAECLGLDAGGEPEAAEKALREATGVPGPRTVTYDMGDKARYDVLTGALEMLASYQRHEARAEGPNGARRLEWAALASAMLHEADTARNAEDVKEARDGT